MDALPPNWQQNEDQTELVNNQRKVKKNFRISWLQYSKKEVEWKSRPKQRYKFYEGFCSQAVFRVECGK
jgi:hypothetical protein